MKQHKYIHCLDNASWRVRIRNGPEMYIKYFKFSAYDGKTKALACAIEWRDFTLEQHGLLDRLKYKKAPDLHSSNKNKAVIGVFRTHTIQRGKRFDSWTARGSLDEIECKRVFSIHIYGEKKAFLKACETRFALCGKLKIINKALLPCKIPRKFL